MKLTLSTPDRPLLEESVIKVAGEAQNGCFVLLPRHVDFVTALVPGILSYTTEQEKECFVALDEGVLVKCGDQVRVSCRSAATGGDLGELEKTIRESFLELDRREQRSRAALARLEAEWVHQFVKLREPLT